MLKRSLPFLLMLAFSAQASAATFSAVPTVSQDGKTTATAQQSMSLLQLAASGMMFSFKAVTGQAGHDAGDGHGNSSETQACPEDNGEPVTEEEEKKTMSRPDPIYFGF